MADPRPTVVITGSASGIGLATFELLKSRGWLAVGVDLRDAEIVADLSLSMQRQAVVERIAAQFPSGLNALITCAGIRTRNEAKVVSVNYFGTTEILEGVLPTLAKAEQPRAVAVSSFAATMKTDVAIIDACLDGVESWALEASLNAVATDPVAPIVYTSSKLAVARWIRRRQ